MILLTEVSVVIKENGLEEVIRLDPENDPEFDDTLAEVLCRLFGCSVVDFTIKGYDAEETGLN